ncbi:Nramp family divalent metal transporter [Candidatus Latescibacterota bacterium]
MNNDSKKKPFIGRLFAIFLAIGPGIFCIGYTIGTGSVTSMAKAGSQFGMQLLWVLVLSCIFSWILMEAFGRFAIVTGETALHGLKRRYRYGSIFSILILVGVVVAQWGNFSGLIGLTSNGIYEAVRLFIPGLNPENYWGILGIAVLILLVLYSFLLVGKYSFFEKILVIFVTLMGLSFIVSMFIVMPPPLEIVSGLIPQIPDMPGAKLMIAAFVGTTMAAPTFIVRPLLMKGKGWTSENISEQRQDSFSAALFMLIISGSIMVCATGALFHRGLIVNRVLDMVYTLEPVAGKFAVALFLVGTVSAGLSSAFPIMMVAPLLIGDYRAGELDTKSPLFRILAGIACLIALTVPILGANPIAAQIATQITGVFVLPLVIASIFFMVNRKEEMGEHKAGLLLNTGIVTAFIFSCIISYTAIIAIKEFIISL